MMPVLRLAVIAGAAVVAALAGLQGYRAYYQRPRQALDGEISRYAGAVNQREEELAGATNERQRLRGLGASSLGRSEEEVAAEARSAVNQIALALRLIDPKVATRPAMPVNSPATAKVDDLGVKRGVQSTDFYAVPITFTARGDLDEVVRTLATLDAQPWVHRIERFVMTPSGPKRELVDLTLDMVTLFVPESEYAGKRDPGAARWTEPDPAQLEKWMVISKADRFREPPPPPPAPPVAVQQEPKAAPPPKPTGPGYADFRVAAVVHGSAGWEVWLIGSGKAGDGATKVVKVGDKVLEATLVDASGERAVFEEGGKRFTVGINKSLAEREAPVQ
jgi:hypothetical protein